MTAKNQQKKVLVFCQHFWPEEFRINDICKGFVEKGIHVDVICGIPNYPTGKIFKGWGFFKRTKENWNGVNIKRVWEIPRGNNKLVRILINFISWPFFSLFYLPFIGKGYDCIFCYQLSPVFMSFPAILYKWFTKKPLYIYILDYWPFSVFAVMNIKNMFIKQTLFNLSKWHYKKADGIICAFEGIRDKLNNEMDIKMDKTIYIPQACEKIHETSVYDEEIYMKYKENFNIVFTGSVNPAQSFETIIAAAKLTFDSGYNKIHWIIVGDGMSRKEVENEVNMNGLSANFHFEGQHPVEDLPKYYYIANAFVVALKKSELGDFGVPAKVQSYLAAGKPILGAMDGDANKLINENNLGFCGQANNEAELYENIKKLYLLKEDERKSIENNMRDFHLKNFERDYQLDRLVKYIH